jgi:hypothetical protein
MWFHRLSVIDANTRTALRAEHLVFQFRVEPVIRAALAAVIMPDHVLSLRVCRREFSQLTHQHNELVSSTGLSPESRSSAQARMRYPLTLPAYNAGVNFSV